MFKKILAGAMTACILTFGTVAGVSAESIDSLQSKLDSLKEEDAKYQEILNSTKEDISEKEAYSDALVNKIGVLNEQLSLNHSRSDELDASISQLQKDIDSANENISTQMQTLKNRIRTIYMAGGASDLEIILGAKDFGDFLDKLELVKTLSAYDSNLINGIKDKLTVISENKADLELQKQELAQVEQELQSGQEELQSLLDENQELLASLYSQNDSILASIASASSEKSDVERQIEEYYAQQKAAQEQVSQSSQSDQSQQGGSSDSGSGGTDPDPSPSPIAPSGGGYVWPCPGYYYLSSEWNENRGGYNHGAIDIAGGGIMGATVVAADSGTVISSYSSCIHNWGKGGTCGCGGNYGNYVWIDHGNGKATIYAHLSSLAVSTGQYVSKGQVIGYVGSTGQSTGPHLHFECRYYGTKYNPMTEF